MKRKMTTIMAISIAPSVRETNVFRREGGGAERGGGASVYVWLCMYIPEGKGVFGYTFSSSSSYL